MFLNVRYEPYPEYTREEAEAILQETEELQARAQELIAELTTETTDNKKEDNTMTYNYFEAVKADVLEYISENVNLAEWRGDRDGLEEDLNDRLWIDDSVTGNASGSYTFSTWKAEENLCHNWDLLQDALSEFGFDENPIERGAEWCDVTIRCYLLNQAISEALDELEEELEEPEED